MNRTLAAAAIAASLVSLAGCNANKSPAAAGAASANSSASPTAAAASPAGSVGTTSASLHPDLVSYCHLELQVQNDIAAVWKAGGGFGAVTGKPEGTPNPGNVQAGIKKVIGEFPAWAETAPVEITDLVRNWEGIEQKLYDGIANANYDLSAVDKSVIEEWTKAGSGPDAAPTKVKEFGIKNCMKINFPSS